MQLATRFRIPLSQDSGFQPDSKFPLSSVGISIQPKVWLQTQQTVSNSAKTISVNFSNTETGLHVAIQLATKKIPLSLPSLFLHLLHVLGWRWLLGRLPKMRNIWQLWRRLGMILFPWWPVCLLFYWLRVQVIHRPLMLCKRH